MISQLLRALDAPRWPASRLETPAGTLLPHGALDLSRRPLRASDALALAPSLAAHPALRVINLSAASLTDLSLTHLFARDLSAARWERLHLGANALCADATERLARDLAAVTSLRALLLKRTALHAAAVRAVCALPSLRTLDLAGCKLGPEALIALADALPHTSLEAVFLSGNPVSLEAAERLGPALARSSLHALHLCHCALSNASLAALAQSLPRARELRVLDLASNGFGPSAARPLASIVESTPLTELRLGRVAWTDHAGAPANSLRDEGARGLIPAFARSTTLTRLDLSHNQLSLGAIRALVDALQTHPTVATVHLGAPLPADVLFQLMSLSCRNAPARAVTPAWRRDLDALRPDDAPRSVQRDGSASGGLSALDDDDLYAVDLRPTPVAPQPSEASREFTDDELATTARVLRAMLARPRLLTDAHPELSDLRGLCLALSRSAHAQRVAPRPEAPRSMVHAPSRRRPARSRDPSEDAGDAAAAEPTAPSNCYVCKQPSTERHPAYRSLCYPCGALNFVKRQQSADLAGRVCLVTGSRVKVGYHVVLKLLRAGATVLATSRFPRDAARRFAQEPDFTVFRERLSLERLDLRFIPEVERFAEHLARTLPRLDVIVHNAAQTVRRPDAHWTALEALESVVHESLPETLRRLCPEGFTSSPVTVAPSALALVQGDLMAVPQEPVDPRPTNSWRLRMDEVSTQEVVEVHAVNAIAPYVLTSKLRGLMARSPQAPRFVVNVSAVEGQFYRAAKSPAHPHTNMAKAALNMLTRTAAQDLCVDGIYMNSVDTGWLSNDNPLAVVERMAAAGFEPPLDAIDAAARVLDPVFTGVRTGECVWGLFLKDFRPASW